MSTHWRLADIPDLHGRTALVTGVTSGLGEQTALELARRGAEVVLAARSPAKLEATVGLVRAAAPSATLHPLVVDLADLASVRRAAQEAAGFGPIHILVNNAGVMATPHMRTVDGFELQFGTNHLGHFALTGLLLPQLLSAGGSRVVAVSSHGARMVRRVPLSDPRVPTAHYRKWPAYAASKLANLLFMFELDRRAKAAGLAITSVAAHPGYTSTALVSSGMNLDRRRLDGTIADAATRVVAQPAALGATPLLMAATAPGLRGGTYIGPSGPFQIRGLPTVVQPPSSARDEEMAAGLWALSEAATGVGYEW